MLYKKYMFILMFLTNYYTISYTFIGIYAIFTLFHVEHFIARIMIFTIKYRKIRPLMIQ